MRFQTSALLDAFIDQMLALCPDAIMIVLDGAGECLLTRHDATQGAQAEACLQALTAAWRHPREDRPSVWFDAIRHYAQDIHIEAGSTAATLHLCIPMLHAVQMPAAPSSPARRPGKLWQTRSPVMQQMLTIIERVAVTEFPVLVRGESGSGKELVAEAIHQLSPRQDKPFIAVNCAALNVNILESELFGHVKGAFTGAIRDHKGVFERAAGGTLFLDEVAEIPLELQAKLLRVLETGEFNRLGGEKLIRADVRIIAATHRALREEARLGRFRQDLLYRLRVIPIFLPPLRERKEDIPDIIRSILAEHRSASSVVYHEVNAGAMAQLLAYDWPGNVRELKNTLLYALAMAGEETLITTDHLPMEILSPQTEQASDLRASRGVDRPDDDHPNVDNVATPEQIRQVLALYHDNQAEAAKALGISRTTLWRYRKKYLL